MEKRTEADGGMQGAGPSKKIKTENPTEDMLLRVPSAQPSSSPQPVVAHGNSTLSSGNSNKELRASSVSQTNLDKLANLAAQRSEIPGGVSLNIPGQSSPSSTLPLSLQRLQAMRQQQQQQQQSSLTENTSQQQNGQGSSTPGPSSQSHAAPHATTAASASNSSSANQAGSSYDQLIDVMGYSGVDLRAEEAFINQNGSTWDDSHAASVINTAGLAHGLYLNVYPLSNMVHRIAKQYGLSVDAATLDYLSIATRMRFRNLLESMVRASRHRAWSTHQRTPPMYPDALPDGSHKPMYHEEMLSNPVKQLAGIEKAERIEEGNWRRMRIEREENEAAALEAGGEDGTPKSKKRSGASSRNLSEDVRKRLADSTAMRHLGANNVTSKYAWLQSPGTRGTSASRPRETPEQLSSSNDSPGPRSNSSLPKPKFAPSGGGQKSAAQAVHAGAWSDVALRQAAQREQERIARARVTLHDALAALEREQAAGAGNGTGRRALYMAQAFGSGRGSL